MLQNQYAQQHRFLSQFITIFSNKFTYKKLSFDPNFDKASAEALLFSAAAYYYSCINVQIIFILCEIKSLYSCIILISMWYSPAVPNLWTEDSRGYTRVFQGVRDICSKFQKIVFTLQMKNKVFVKCKRMKTKFIYL